MVPEGQLMSKNDISWPAPDGPPRSSRHGGPPHLVLSPQHSVLIKVLGSKVQGPEIHRFTSSEVATQNPEPLFEHLGPGLKALDFVGSVAA